jgi:hypothetical protein
MKVVKQSGARIEAKEAMGRWRLCRERGWMDRGVKTGRCRVGVESGVAVWGWTDGGEDGEVV